ncbi:acyl-CoA thioester hydrolase [Arthrobacter sp. ov407]|uniref:acyl-CoA thioesterase n=1 Tax=Arthrobacter sp. ov407 TaxID=1761748 RepID=UPI000888CB9E|nr:thioesterase family protein [Arthrobacter sp. ov407]SDL07271.1 acyl-CoA thioester hydrolase [Arthrobacter sp. ov407]
MSELDAQTSTRPPQAGVSSASIERTVEWVDTDAAGHQHNSAIMRWAESAEAELFRQLDLPEYFPSAPRVHQAINFRAKLWFGQRVTTTLWVQAMGGKSMTFGFEVVAHPMGEHDGGLAADGTFVTAYVPVGADASAPWPERFRAAIKAAA